MRRRFPIFLLVLTVLTGSWFWYLGSALIDPIRLSTGTRAWVWAIFSLPFLSMFALPFFFWSRMFGTPRPWHNKVVHVSYLSFGYLSILFTLVAVSDLFRLLAIGASWAAPRAIHLPPLTGSSMSFALIALSVLLFAFGLFESYRTPSVTRVSVPLAGIAAGTSVRIAQLSDVHIGYNIKRAFVDRVVKRVNSLEPDLIVLTGDIVDGTVPDLRDDFGALSALSAKQGVFYITGNHEYYWGGDAWIEEARRIGLQPLLNESKILRFGSTSMLVAGLPDYAASLFGKTAPCDPATLLEGKTADVRLLLVHQPKGVAHAAESGYDLQLSGHTHAGQFIPWTLFISLFHPVARGLKRVQKMWAYVNRGTGTWGPPLRIGAPAEITLLTLTAA